MFMSSPDSVAKSARQAMLDRPILGWLAFDRFLLIAALLVVFVIAATMGTQSDTWWLLRTGELIVRTWHIPTTDVYSSTVPGGYWPNHEWLAEVLLYGCYAIGGLPLLFLACAALMAWAWYGIARLSEGAGVVRAVALLIGAASQAPIWSVRPHLFSLALLVLVLLLLPARRLHWIYPLVFLLWANLHAGVAFGGVVLGVAFVVALAMDALRYYRDRVHPQERTPADGGRWTTDDVAIVSSRLSIVWPKSFAESAHWLLVLLASGLATLINPLGVGLWQYVLASFGDQTRSYLSEWQPPNLSWPASYPFFILVGLVVVAVAWSRRSWAGRRDWVLLALALVFGLLGMRSIRHTACFAIVAVPLLTRPFRDRAPHALRSARQGASHALILLALAASGALLVGRWWAEAPGELLSADVVDAVRTCTGTLYNTYDTGGPLIWQAPERPVFVDNRQDPYPADLLFKAVIAEQQGDYRALFATYHVACALTPYQGALDQALRRDGWQELGHDQRLVVLRHP
jgi:hypothetical protein